MTSHNAPYVAESDTSRARAQFEDATGQTRQRRTEITRLVAARQQVGATWAEIAEQTGYHHGQVSGALSKLHEMGHLFQLKATRNGCHPYVYFEYRDMFHDDDVNDHPVKTRASRRNAALENVARAAYELCYSQSKHAAAKWDALRVALAELKEYEQ